jgi:arabinose-5-phosphate isomerase
MIDIARKVLEMESEAIRNLIERLDHKFEEAVALVLNCKGRVVVTGMGKSGLIGKKIAATLSSTGSPSLFMHPAEALHGDLGVIVSGDVVIAISQSGQTDELVALLETIQRLGASMIAITGRSDSVLARHAQVVLDVRIENEACPMGLVPTASTTASLAMGDALAIAVLSRRGFTAEDFAALHPGGQLGRRLLHVENLMHTGESVPRVRLNTNMKEVIYEMTKKGLGITTVVDDRNDLLGILSDGDLRRALERDPLILERDVSEFMTRDPVTINPDELAVKALHIMESKKITSIVVLMPGSRKVEGLIHIHDLWRTQMF